MALILLIDDDRELRWTLRLMLEEAGHEVVEAADGVAGVELQSRIEPELIVTDIIMPEKEGIETILDLRRHDPNARIIAISGGGRLTPDDFLSAARRLGAYRSLKKPFRREQLLEAIDACLTSTAA